MNCSRGTPEPHPRVAGLLGDPGALLENRVGEAHDALHAGARGGGDLLGGLAGADPRLDHPRGQRVARIRRGPAARRLDLQRRPQPLVDAQLEPLAVLGGPGVVDGQHQALAVVGERHEAQCAHERATSSSGSVRIREVGPAPRYPRVGGARGRHARSGASARQRAVRRSDPG
jgi:hypothetical protein